MKKKLIIIFILGFIFAALNLILNLEVFKPIPTNIEKVNKVQVAASFYPIYFFASKIGKDKADIINITPAGAEPHDYEPTTQQMAKINQSNLLIFNGGKLEGWGDKIKDQLKGTNILIVEAGEGLTTKKDPHFWLDPVLAKKEVENILRGFEKADSKNAEYFKLNAKALESKLDKLDLDFKNGLSNCQKKNFVTSHEAFGYLAARYKINQIAINGLSPEEEPSAQKLAEIADLVKKEGIKIIFFENLVSPKLSETLANETGAKTMVLDPIEGITPDKLKTGADYFTVMRENLINLMEALECK